MKSTFALVVLVALLVVATVVLLRSDGEGERRASTSTPAASALTATPLALEEINATKRSSPPGERPETALPSSRTAVGTAPENTATLLVRVRSKDSGEALADVQLWLSVEDSEGCTSSTEIEGSRAVFGESPRTDSQGRAQFQVPSGSAFHLRTWGEQGRYGPSETEVPALGVGEARELLLEVRTDLEDHYFGRVIDAESGMALPGASVSIESLSEFLPGTELSVGPVPEIPVAVDGEGYFETDARPGEGLRAWVEAPEHASTWVTFEKGHVSRATACEIRLLRSASLEVLVLGPARAPLPDATVRVSTEWVLIVRLQHSPATLLRSEDLHSLKDLSWAGRSGIDGRCVLSSLPSRLPLSVEVAVVGQVPRREAEPLTLEPGELRRLEINVAAGARVSGRLLDDTGAAVEGAEIWFEPADDLYSCYLEPHETDGLRKTITGASGSFVFDLVPDGTWVVGPSPKGPFAPQAQIVRVASGIPDRESSLTAWRDLFLGGTVVDPAGTPKAGVAVMAYSKELGAHTSGETDNKGRFSVGPLAHGEYTLIASVQFGPGNASLADSEPLAAHSGDASLVLHMRSGGGLSGRLVDAASGTGLAGRITISATGGSLDSKLLSMHWARDDGVFSFGGLLPGRYDLCGGTKSGNFAILTGVDVNADSVVERLRLEARPGGRLRALYQGEEGHCQIRVFLDDILVVVDEIKRGSMCTSIVPAATLRVDCIERRPERTTSRTIEVVVGGESTVSFGEN